MVRKNIIESLGYSFFLECHYLFLLTKQVLVKIESMALKAIGILAYLVKDITHLPCTCFEYYSTPMYHRSIRSLCLWGLASTIEEWEQQGMAWQTCTVHLSPLLACFIDFQTSLKKTQVQEQNQ